MTDLVLVDWLPRGGIAQTTAAWRDVARRAGLDVVVVSRAGSEHEPDVAVAPRLPGKAGAVEAHLRLVRRATEVVRDLRPATVYVQHTWAPLLERPLLAAARAAGSRTVLAVHNARPHHRLVGGLRTGLRRLVAEADAVVVHSRHVQAQLDTADATLVPLPEHATITRAEPVPVAGLAPRGLRRAVSFGVLRRGYKGVADLGALAAGLGPGWEVVGAGVGADRVGPGVRAHAAYLDPGELRWLVESADVVVLPYREASQSGAVSVAQSLGVPPVASAVGGIPEQVDDGRTGVLVPAGVGAAAWVEAVERASRLDRRGVHDAAAARDAGAAAAWRDVVSPDRAAAAARPGRRP